MLSAASEGHLMRSWEDRVLRAMQTVAALHRGFREEHKHEENVQKLLVWYFGEDSVCHLPLS